MGAVGQAPRSAFKQCRSHSRPSTLNSRVWDTRYHSKLLKLCVLGLGLLQDRDVWICVFPEGKKILIRAAGFGDVALEGVGATQLEMCQCADGFIQNNATMIEDFLKLCRSFAALMCSKIGF